GISKCTTGSMATSLAYIARWISSCLRNHTRTLNRCPDLRVVLSVYTASIALYWAKHIGGVLAAWNVRRLKQLIRGLPLGRPRVSLFGATGLRTVGRRRRKTVEIGIA